MDQRPILNKLESIEKLQGQMLYYIREIAEHNPAGKVPLPENVFNDQEVMFKMSWSKSTLKRRRAEGLLPFNKIGNKFYYKEKDVLFLLFPDILHLRGSADSPPNDQIASRSREAGSNE